MIAELILAASPLPAPVDKEKVQAGFIGLAFFLIMGLVVLALVMSMRRHLQRVDITRHAREKASRRPPPGGAV